MPRLKGNCSNGDIECGAGKSDRTYDTRFTNFAVFNRAYQKALFYIRDIIPFRRVCFDAK
ncbi:MAG TPA: hypothetical protein IAC46_02975 [Candidatus Onthoplasma faecigallinarum]|nr:hypothetical protein [Candidatus Onthoplasma faecigallinarum]